MTNINMTYPQEYYDALNKLYEKYDVDYHVIVLRAFTKGYQVGIDTKRQDDNEHTYRYEGSS